MLDPSAVPPTMQPVEPAQQFRESAPTLYILFFTFAPVALLALSFFIASKPWFLLHDNYPMLRNSLGYSLRAPACEIVIYGDSTALAGYDPAIIQQKTGLSTCNISEVLPIQYFVGSDYPLDLYLARNPRPKFLLIGWEASSFHPVPDSFGNAQGPPEGVMYALNYGHYPHLWRNFLKTPKSVVKFGIWVEYSLIQSAMNSAHGIKEIDPFATHGSRDQLRGLLQYPSPPQTQCTRKFFRDPLTMPLPQTAAAISAFRERYSAGGTRVLIDVTPIADCSTDKAELLHSTQGLSDNQLEFLPIGLFNASDVHLGPAGSPLVSAQAADQILALMHQDDAAKYHLAASSAKGPGKHDLQ